MEILKPGKEPQESWVVHCKGDGESSGPRGCGSELKLVHEDFFTQEWGSGMDDSYEVVICFMCPQCGGVSLFKKGKVSSNAPRHPLPKPSYKHVQAAQLRIRKSNGREESYSPPCKWKDL